MSANTAGDLKQGSERVGLEFDPEINNRAIESLKEARIMTLFKSPFFGQLALRLPLVNADAWLPTAATDGKHFYYNSRFINMLKPEECVFLFGHEILHAVYDHMGRFEGKDKQLANIAADYVVNGDLVDQRMGVKITTVPALHDTKFRGWSMEEVYDYLYDNADKIDIQQLADQLLDEHVDGEGDGTGEGDGKGDISTDKDGNMISKSKPRLSKEEMQQVRDQVRAATIQASKMAEAGNVPAGVKRMIDDLLNPKMNWRDLLRATLQSMHKRDHSFMRPSRKSWHTGATLPGLMPEDTVDVVVAMDLSGSIGVDQMRDFLTEVKGIMDEFMSFKLKLFTFDTQVYNEQDFDETTADEIFDYDFQGGGGTDFMACWEYMKENDIVPERFVMFTDGYPCGSWGDPDYCETVFIVHNGGYGTSENSPKAPFGQTAVYDEVKNNQ